MDNVYVYDLNFNFLGVIDEYVSLIWRPAYYDIGDCELYVGVSDKLMGLLQVNRLLVRDKDISVDNNGNTTHKNIMIIKAIDLTTNVENGDFLAVTGKELKFILHQRIVWQQTNLNGNLEESIRSLVSDNAIYPSYLNRAIPNLELGAISGITDYIEKQLTGEALDVAITDICRAYKIGWDVYALNGTYVFVLYKGVDRSYGQSERPYVVFSDDFNNLYDTEYQINTENYGNTALIGGEGDGTERTFATVNDDLIGFDRYEVFVDAKDLSSNKNSSDPSKRIPESEYIRLLQERGKDNLAEYSITEGFSGNVVDTDSYRFGVDYDIGDTVTVINSYGIRKNVMVLSSIESEDETGVYLIPQFNI